MTHSRRDVLDLLDRHGLKPSRALGQNFVADANTVRRIAWLAEVGPGDRVIEVGAGLGSLTLALAETGADVTAVEVDRHVLPALREVVANTDVTIVEADAMSVDWHALVDDRDHVLVANLPYNIATPLVADLLDAVPELKRMLVMVQREVGERLAAHVGDDGYGAVSVKVDYWADARVVGHVPASVFVPRPNVESALVRIDRRAHPKIDVDPSLLFPLVRAGFGQRRKMLRRALADVVDADAFACAGVRPEARAEELDVDAWGRLARCVHRRS
ncbi:MAG TPA: 16S rRNA (adenine(1518)-N(6)/adenine(1519)-N(6))-dimethyltransferase RsmA [Acidimicrobiales bacterium]|nr:16S rRNA (adenine(1518)-N(6)/adenine(1519)-N(6))-dimethyltransferase RsmA [Acidimicrobiales bacterium]